MEKDAIAVCTLVLCGMEDVGGGAVVAKVEFITSNRE